MPDFSNPSWQGIGVVIGVVISILSFIGSVVVSKRLQERKLLCWDITVTNTLSVFEISPKIKVQATFENQLLEDAVLLDLKLWNAGNKAITATDYERPLKFIFPQHAKLLEVNLLLQVPPDIVEKPEDLVKFTTDAIEFDPKIALNPGNRITLRALITPLLDLGEVGLAGKIVGGSIQSQVNTELSSIGYLTSTGWGCAQFLAPFIIFLTMLLRALPMFIVLAGISGVIYFFFGEQALINVFMYFMFTMMPLGIWSQIYIAAAEKLRKKNISYNPLKLALWVGLIPLTMLALFWYAVITLLH